MNRAGSGTSSCLRRTSRYAGPLLLLLPLACSSEVTLSNPTPTPEPTLPPAEDPYGDPPEDWDTCTGGYQGRYYNLPSSHPDVEPEDPDLPDGTSPADLDWWDPSYYAFEHYDANLDFGTGWWPVDAGLEGDPAYFSVRWTAWIRFYSRDPVTFSLGSADDAWVMINGEVAAALPGIHDFDVQSFTWTPPAATQYPIDVYFAHRASAEDGFRLRISGDRVVVCYPEY